MVKELDNCDIIVTKELGDSSVQVLEHSDYNIVGALAEVLRDSNAVLICVKEAC